MYTNIAGYKFISLDNLDQWQAMFIAHTELCRGTILLSPEGININLAGTAENIQQFSFFLATLPLFADLILKPSLSEKMPFKFMRVKIKNEIITMHQPTIEPTKAKAESLSPHTLKQWLDEKRQFTLLDTRNGYEVAFGSFEQAMHLNIDDFSDFPQASLTITKDKPVVMFCTGGIRCEKAALYMEKQGYEQVYQLEGGILNYFAQVGGAHYDGECFVFDQRISLNTSLQETGTSQCLTCFGPVSANTHHEQCNLSKG